MAEGDGVLRMKLAARSAPSSGRMSAEKAMAVAFGRAGRVIPGLGLRLAGISRERVDLTDLGEAFEPGALAMLLVQRGEAVGEGAAPLRPDYARPTSTLRAESPAMFTSSRGRPRPAPDEGGVHGGLVIADCGLVTALVEARMTGTVSPAEPAPRPPTRIDALIVAGLVDAALAQFDELVPELSMAASVSNWQAGGVVPAATAVRLTLKEGLFICFTLDVDLGDGVRQGRMTLAMPEAPPVRKASGQGGKAANELAQVVLQTRSDLRAVLTRMTVPLSRLSQWEPGHTIPIPRSSLTGVRIEDIEGELVGHGRLGQLTGSRAVRLTSNAPPLPEPDFSAAEPVVLAAEGYGGRI